MDALKVQTLEVVLFQIDGLFRLIIAHDDYEAFREAVLSAQDVNAPELRNWLSDRFPKIATAVEKEHAANAWIAFVQAQQSHDNGDSAAAWYHVSQAKYQEGRLDSHFVAMQRIDRIRAAGRRGGQTTGLKRSPLMRECLKLLNLLRPLGGWGSHEHAFQSMAAELLDFSRRQGEELTREELLPRVIGWLAKHPDFQEAFEGEDPPP